MLEPTVEELMLDPTLESERLEPIVDRWSVELTPDEVSSLSVDSPMSGPARPVAPISKPETPPAPMFRLLFGVAPIS
jgi:hypothetical protein